MTGNFAGYRECHISPDWLLICKKDTAIRLITLIRLYAQGHTQNCSNNPIQAKIHIIPALHPGTAGVFSCLRRWNGFCNFTSINQPKNKEGKIMTTPEERKKLSKESMDLVIKRSGVSKKEIVEEAMKRFFNDNIDLLTPEELEKYKSVIL